MKTHEVNAGYTILARLKEDRARVVSALLIDMNAHPERLPFSAAMTTHFATGAVMPAQTWSDEALPATLMIATSFSGPSTRHETDLATHCGAGLRELFQHCEGFPENCSDADLIAYMRDHRRAETFYSGMQHLSRTDVLRYVALRTAIQDFVDRTPPASTAVDTRRAIHDHVVANGFPWVDESYAPGDGWFMALHWRTMVLAAVLVTFVVTLLGTTTVALVTGITGWKIAAALCWLLLFGAVILLLLLIAEVRFAEIAQRDVAGRPPDRHVRDLAETQCNPVINEMTIIGAIKNGTTRPMVMRIALWIVARLAEGIPKLRTGIDIPTVATARWIATDNGRRLVFISNFTNDAEPYVRDFIDTHAGAMRINLTFGFGNRYPITKWLVFGGAVDDPNGFIHVVHANQRKTELWFCPYKDLSIDNIKLARKIREGLYGDATEDEARDWLLLL